MKNQSKECKELRVKSKEVKNNNKGITELNIRDRYALIVRRANQQTLGVILCPVLPTLGLAGRPRVLLVPRCSACPRVIRENKLSPKVYMYKYI